MEAFAGRMEAGDTPTGEDGVDGWACVSEVYLSDACRAGDVDRARRTHVAPPGWACKE